MIKFNNLFKSFNDGKSFVVNDVSFEVPDGKTVVLLGSSGCGKTTLLKMVNRLIDPTSGTITIDDKDVMHYDPVELRRAIGYAFQGVGLFPHMTVSENLTIVLKLMKVPRSERKNVSCRLLDSVKLNPIQFANRYPDELSGGQQQRIGVARALATHPKYLLMDEPFGALDAINRDAMQEEIVRIREEYNTTILFVTHDLFEAIRLGDLIVVMSKGRIEQIGTAAELINNPQTPYVETLFQNPLNQLKWYQQEVQ